MMRGYCAFAIGIGLALLSAPSLPLAARAALPVAAPITEIPHVQPEADDAERLLALHNRERARLGLPPLSWNARLARDANRWADVLLARGRLQHASLSDRDGRGENLWMGTAGAWNVDGMIEMFLYERRYFRPATFPDVSLTGDWTDVGHYSQIVWRDTREVGCAVRTGGGKDALVCRYFPAGNVPGRDPF